MYIKIVIHDLVVMVLMQTRFEVLAHRSTMPQIRMNTPYTDTRPASLILSLKYQASSRESVNCSVFKMTLLGPNL